MPDNIVDVREYLETHHTPRYHSTAIRTAEAAAVIGIAGGFFVTIAASTGITGNVIGNAITHGPGAFLGLGLLALGVASTMIWERIR